VRSAVCNNTGQSAGNWDTTDENDKPHTSRLETTSRKRNQKQNESTTRKKKKKKKKKKRGMMMLMIIVIMKMAHGELRE
jgi:hypothetical protein